jgi:hypothetical protein
LRRVDEFHAADELDNINKDNFYLFEFIFFEVILEPEESGWAAVVLDAVSEVHHLVVVDFTLLKD